MDIGKETLKRTAEVFSQMGEVRMFPHYAMKQIDTIDQVLSCFPDGRANRLNWLFLSTSGVHGTYRTLDEIEHEKADSVITVLIIQPRLCVMRYGDVEIEPEHIPVLRRLVRTTLAAVSASQEGNI